MCVRVCVCVVYAGKLVNTQLAVLFDTPGGLEDISHLFYTCILQRTFSSSSSLHLICTISLHPSVTAVTGGESTHPQLWSEGWGTFLKAGQTSYLYVFMSVIAHVCRCVSVSWWNPSMDVDVWMRVGWHTSSLSFSALICLCGETDYIFTKYWWDGSIMQLNMASYVLSFMEDSPTVCWHSEREPAISRFTR